MNKKQQKNEQNKHFLYMYINKISNDCLPISFKQSTIITFYIILFYLERGSTLIWYPFLKIIWNEYQIYKTFIDMNSIICTSRLCCVTWHWALILLIIDNSVIMRSYWLLSGLALSITGYYRYYLIGGLFLSLPGW